jgi:hypothetical protein
LDRSRIAYEARKALQTATNCAGPLRDGAGGVTVAGTPQLLRIRHDREEHKEALPVPTQPPPVTGPDAGSDHARGRSLHERESEEMARVADAMRAASARLPPDSQIGRELATWASRLAFAAEVHRLLGTADDEESHRS